jgi:hypothetical protein
MELRRQDLAAGAAYSSADGWTLVVDDGRNGAEWCERGDGCFSTNEANKSFEIIAREKGKAN